MKFRRILAFSLALFLCFNIVGCRNENTNTKDGFSSSSSSKKDKSNNNNDSESITPLLYKVTDNNGNTAWLFGSIHVGRDDYYPLPDYVLDAFDASDALAVECNVNEFEKDYVRQYKMLAKLMYSDGTTIKDHIPDELYNSSVEILKDLNLYNTALDYYFPIFWSQSIESVLYEVYGADSELGIDVHLMERASKKDKEILEIESVEFQYQMMADFSEELQILLLQSTISSYGEDINLEAELNDLMDLWASGDEVAFNEYFTDDTSDLTGDEKLLYDEYNNAMIVNRNIAMADYVETALESGDEIFICVGAAHIIGDGGVAQLIKERGYTVETIKGVF